VPQIKSIEGFKDFCALVTEEPSNGKPCLVICAGTGGQASGSNDIIRIIKRQLLERNLHDRISLRITGCLGFCEMDPFVIAEPGDRLYPKLHMEDIPRIIDATLEGNVINELLFGEREPSRKYDSQQEIPFFKGQTRTILGYNQHLDPIRILDYIRVGGYRALGKVLIEPDPGWIIEQIKKSELRGRGGAGFPTGRKWELMRRFSGKTTQSYIVCNADEGDPGAYMDRSLLEGNPHAILEGMIIAGVATGATKGIIYVRSEYPLAIKHSLIAIRQAREIGVLGHHILGSGLDFDVEIVRGAGAFVCGEETALIKSVEGKMGEPRQRPPYPIEKGIHGCPTCINNVETLANVPVIIRRGAEEYSEVGIPGNRGTKIFSLVGKIRRTGLVEVPLGTPIRQVVYNIGGGPVGQAKIKAVQTGGPSGGCIPARLFDLPIDYDSLVEAGSIMGSGGMIVMDDNTCVVDIAKYFMRFLKDESCGKCFTCRKGIQRMHEILDDISRGNASLGHLDLLEELANVVKDTTMCGLGQSAPNPVLSTLRYFREEYVRHVERKRCDAFVCRDLVGAPCQTACPLGTESWRYIAHIARGELGDAYLAIREHNPFPSICARVCSHPCESRCRLGTIGNEPISVRALKRFVTDRIDPGMFRPEKSVWLSESAPRVAVVGAGPAGLAASHYLSLQGVKVTLLEAEKEPGGMMITGIPSLRLPRDILKEEIRTILDENVTLKCGIALCRDVSVDDLFNDGFKAVFIATGAHKSQRLNIEGEDSRGVSPAMDFLRAGNLRGEEMGRGHVGVIGGGNSAIDAARVAIRQKGVQGVTLFYRRTQQEMPAFREEIEAALEEGVHLETLVSPVKINAVDGQLAGLVYIRNRLGDYDESGRRRPVPIPGEEYSVSLDTLIIAIGERPDTGDVSPARIETNPDGTIMIDSETLVTSRPGVFAGGDVVTGPGTVVEAIAAGKRAAGVIHQYLSGEEMKMVYSAPLPGVYVEPAAIDERDRGDGGRAKTPLIPVESRRRNFAEVEGSLSIEEAMREARRCLRCDLEFTHPNDEREPGVSGE